MVFFFNDTATTEIYTLSLHDALPILLTGGFLHGGILHLAFNMYALWWLGQVLEPALGRARYLALYFTALLAGSFGALLLDRKSTRLNSSHANISYAVFCLKKKKIT